MATKTYMHSILITINNTGDIIPTEYLQNIFEPYFTTKGNNGGTGLGLFIASKIVKDRGGKIDVTSGKESGTTFTVDLPHSPCSDID